MFRPRKCVRREMPEQVHPLHGKGRALTAASASEHEEVRLYGSCRMLPGKYEMHAFAVCAQLLIAASIALVWVARFPNVVKEFHEYGLPDLARTVVGATKISLATLLVAGIWYPGPVVISALLMAGLMICAQIAHIRVHHPWTKYMASLFLLVLSLFVAGVYSGKLHG